MTTNSTERIYNAVIGMRLCGNISEPNTECKDCEERLTTFIASEREEVMKGEMQKRDTMRLVHDEQLQKAREEAYETGYDEGQKSRAADISYLLDEEEQAAMKLIREEAKREVIEICEKYKRKPGGLGEYVLWGLAKKEIEAALTHQKQ